MQLTPEDRAMLSPEEVAALESADAQTHLNTMGDTVVAAPEQNPLPVVPDDEPATETQEAADTDATDATDATDGNEGSTTDEAAPAVEAVAEEVAPPVPAKPAAFDVPDTAAMDTQRKALRDQKREILKQWTAGELSDEEYGQKAEEIDDQLAAVIAQQTEAATLQRINAQNAARAQAEAEAAENQAMFNVAQASKAAGLIDYGTNKVASAQFDSLFAAAKLDPANAKLTAQQVVEKTHKAVLALNGLAEAPKPKAKAAEAEPPAAPQPRNVPPSIGGLPNASQTVVQDELFEQFRRLEGEDAERFLASLSERQVDRLMRIADGRAVH